MHIKKFTFNPFQENTYLIYDDEKNCAIIDPGCYTAEEEKILKNYIEENELKPIRLLNTHAHLDHIFGNRFVYDTFQLLPELHIKDLPLIEMAERSAQMYGIPNYKNSPEPEKFIEENTTIEVGNIKLEVIFGPGHAPGHIAFYHKESAQIISGDILFQGSFGRTDLPGGDFNTLKNSIINNFFTLPDDTKVYCGHGPETHIGIEKKNNPILYMQA